jgi:hypothetical protein
VTDILETIGLSKEELADRVVTRTVEQLLSQGCYSDYEPAPSKFQKQLEKQIRRGIDKGVRKIGEEHVHPRVEELIRSTTLQQHNRWGEPRGEPQTFIEYLVSRADAYFTEQVDFEGKTKGEARGYSWSAKTTRVVYLIEKHLQYSIKKAMDEVLEDASKLLQDGLEGGIKTALGDLQKRLKVTVETSRK